MKLAEWGFIFLSQGSQSRSQFGTSRIDNQPLRGVTPPSVGVRQKLNQFLRTMPGHPGTRSTWVPLVFDPINPPSLGIRFKVSAFDVLAKIPGQVVFVLNDPVIHVDEIDRAIGSREEIDRTKTLIGRSEKLPLPHQVFPISQTIIPAHVNEANQIGGRFAKQPHLTKLSWKLISPIRNRTDRTGHRGEISLIINGTFASTIHPGCHSRWVEFVTIRKTRDVIAG